MMYFIGSKVLTQYKSCVNSLTKCNPDSTALKKNLSMFGEITAFSKYFWPALTELTDKEGSQLLGVMWEISVEGN